MPEDALGFFTMHFDADEEQPGRAIEMIREFSAAEGQLERSKWACVRC